MHSQTKTHLGVGVLANDTHLTTSFEFTPPFGGNGPSPRPISRGRLACLYVDSPNLQGEIPALTALPKPWGPKPFEANEADKSHTPPAAFSMQRLAIK